VKGVGGYFVVEDAEFVKLLRHAFQIVLRKRNERTIFEGFYLERAARFGEVTPRRRNKRVHMIDVEAKNNLFPVFVLEQLNQAAFVQKITVMAHLALLQQVLVFGNGNFFSAHLEAFPQFVRKRDLFSDVCFKLIEHG